MTPAGAAFDSFLRNTVADLAVTPSPLAQRIGAENMPEVGGKKLATEFGGMLAGVRKMVDEAKLGIAAAVTELVTEVKSGKQVETALRAEAAEVRKAFGEVLGNAPPEVVEEKKPDPAGQTNGLGPQQGTTGSNQMPTQALNTTGSNL